MKAVQKLVEILLALITEEEEEEEEEEGEQTPRRPIDPHTMVELIYGFDSIENQAAQGMTSEEVKEWFGLF